MIWQRLPMGTGDVKRKRQAFEQQIKAKSVDEKLMAAASNVAATTSSPEPETGSTNGAAITADANAAFAASNKVARRIVELNEDEIAGKHI